MKGLGLFLNILDKMSITAFMCSLSYSGYTNGKLGLSIISLCLSFCFLIYLLKHYRNKPFGNNVIDVFVIIMCLLGFINSEYPIYIGLTAIVAALIDLVYFLYLDHCHVKQKENSN